MHAADPGTPMRAAIQFAPIVRKVGATQARWHRDQSNSKPSYEPVPSPTIAGHLLVRGEPSESEPSAPEHDPGAPPLAGDSRTCFLLHLVPDPRGVMPESPRSVIPEG